METRVSRRSVVTNDQNDNETGSHAPSPAQHGNDDGEEYSIDIKSLVGVFQTQLKASERRALSAVGSGQRKNVGASSRHYSPELRRKSVPASGLHDRHNTAKESSNRRVKDKQVPHRRSTSDLSFNGHRSLADASNREEFDDDDFFETSYRDRFYISQAKFKKIDRQLENTLTASTHHDVVRVQPQPWLNTFDKASMVKAGNTVKAVEEKLALTAMKTSSPKRSSTISSPSHRTEFAEETKQTTEDEETILRKKAFVKTTALQFDALSSTAKSVQVAKTKPESHGNRSASLPRNVRFNGKSADHVSPSPSSPVQHGDDNNALSTADMSKRWSVSVKPTAARTPSSSNAAEKSVTLEKEDFNASSMRSDKKKDSSAISTVDKSRRWSVGAKPSTAQIFSSSSSAVKISATTENEESPSVHSKNRKDHGASSTTDKSRRWSAGGKPSPVSTSSSSSAVKKTVTRDNEEFVASDVREMLKVKKYGRSYSSNDNVAMPLAAEREDSDTSLSQAKRTTDDVTDHVTLTTSKTENETTSPLIIMKKDSSSVASLPLTDAHLLLDEVARKHHDQVEVTDMSQSRTMKTEDHELSVQVAIAIESFSPFGQSSVSKKSQYRHSIYDEKLDDILNDAGVDVTKKSSSLEQKASMEEIDAALKTADSYWQNKNGPSSASLIFDNASKSLKPDTSMENAKTHASEHGESFDSENATTVHSTPDDGDVHLLSDGSYYYEIPGLPAEVQDKPPSKFVTVKFSTQPMKVFATYAADDYDRRNDSVNPIAASAEYELEKRIEKMDLFTTEINKGIDGLGVSIIGMGVGADAGLEKLGIFIKTLSPNGAAEMDGRIKVGDQIIEVDGKSLVGVTQAYAASVLRNTMGRVKFLLGRDKDPENSEVSRLIRQSVDQEQQRMQERTRAEQWQRAPSEMASPAERLAALKRLTGQVDGDEVDGEQNGGRNSPDSSTSSDSETTASDTTEREERRANLENKSNDQLEQVEQLEASSAELEKEREKLQETVENLQQRESQMLDEYKSTRQQRADKDAQFVTEITSPNDKVAESPHSLADSDDKFRTPVTTPPPSADWSASLEQPLEVQTELTLSTKLHGSSPDLSINGDVDAVDGRRTVQPLLPSDDDSVILRTKTPHSAGTGLSIGDNVPESYALLMATTAKPVVIENDKRRDSSDSDSGSPSQRLSVELTTKESATELANLLGEKAFADPLLGSVLTPTEDAPPSYPPPPPPQDDRSRSCSTVTNPDSERLQATVETTISVVARDNNVASDAGVASSDSIAHSNDKVYVNVDIAAENNIATENNGNVYVNVSKEDDTRPVESDKNVAPLVVDVAPIVVDVAQVRVNANSKQNDNTAAVQSASAQKPSKGKISNSKHSYDPSHPPKGKSDVPSSVDDASNRVRLVSSQPIDNGFGQASASSLRRHSSSSSDEFDRHFGQVPVQQSGPSVAVKDRPYQEVPVPLWTPQHVVQWLRSFGLDKIAVHCERADITGDQLLHLDSTRMKSLGMDNNKERDVLKKKIKELKQSVDKRRKQLEKEQKARARLEKQAAPKKKRFAFM